MVREYFLILIFAALSSADHNQLIKDYNPLSALINCSFVPGKLQIKNVQFFLII